MVKLRERDGFRKLKLWEWEVVGTGSGSCSFEHFGIHCVEPSDIANGGVVA